MRLETLRVFIRGEIPLDKTHDFLQGILDVSAMTLATVGPQGEPHAAAVYFAPVYPGAGEDFSALALYFFSSQDSQHSQDLAANYQAAVTIHPECEGWQDIRGLQLRGAVQLVPSGAEWEQAWKAYCARFPFVRQLKAIVAQNSLYVFRPSWVRLVDNRRGFGFKQEWTLR